MAKLHAALIGLLTIALAGGYLTVHASGSQPAGSSEREGTDHTLVESSVEPSAEGGAGTAPTADQAVRPAPRVPHGVPLAFDGVTSAQACLALVCQAASDGRPAWSSSPVARVATWDATATLTWTATSPLTGTLRFTVCAATDPVPEGKVVALMGEPCKQVTGQSPLRLEAEDLFAGGVTGDSNLEVLVQLVPVANQPARILAGLEQPFHVEGTGIAWTETPAAP